MFSAHLAEWVRVRDGSGGRVVTEGEGGWRNQGKMAIVFFLNLKNCGKIYITITIETILKHRFQY